MTPRHTHFPETPQQHRNYTAAPNLLQVVSGKKHLVNERQRARVSQVMTQDLLQHTNSLAPSGLPECHGFSRKAWPARPRPTHAHFRSVSHISSSACSIATLAFPSSLPETSAFRWDWRTSSHIRCHVCKLRLLEVNRFFLATPDFSKVSFHSSSKRAAGGVWQRTDWQGPGPNRSWPLTADSNSSRLKWVRLPQRSGSAFWNCFLHILGLSKSVKTLRIKGAFTVRRESYKCGKGTIKRHSVVWSGIEGLSVNSQVGLLTGKKKTVLRVHMWN